MFQKRLEQRFFTTLSYSKLVSKLKRDFNFQKISDEPYNETIYFDTPNLDMPFELTLRARRYVKTKQFIINKNDLWDLQSKISVLSQTKIINKKKGVVTKLKYFKKIYRRFDSNIVNTSKLSPCLATKYYREHYTHKLYPDLRVTLDLDLSFYFFENEKLIKLGKHQNNILELKYNLSNKKLFGLIKKIKENLNLKSSESKKDLCHNLLNKHLFKKYKNIVPKHDLEIEAKLNINFKNQNIFADFYNFIKSRKIGGFRIYQKFPFILEAGKVQQFNISKKDYVRNTLSKGDNGFTIKTKPIIFKDPYNYNCILIRKELIGSSKDVLRHKKYLELYRKRKYFLIENIKSHNTYCFLIDRSTTKGKPLYQIEIESLANSNDKPDIFVKLTDLQKILYIFIKKYPFVKPTTLTKQQWAIKQ